MDSEQDTVLETQLFAKSGKKLEKLDEKKFKHESELQRLIEENMSDIFEVDYISSEVRVKNFRIDTLGFDQHTNSFVIIEYKRNKSSSVIDQATAYLTILKENQANFVLEYNKKFKRFLESKDFDWEQARIILIARTFNAHQKQAVSKPDLCTELYEIRRYSRDTILLNPVHRVKRNTKKPRSRPAGTTHITNTNDMKKVYQKIERGIVALNSDIQVRPKKVYTAFKLQRNFAFVHLWKNSIDVTFPSPSYRLKDPEQMIEDVTNTGHYGGGNLRIKITKESEVPYLISIISQILKEVNAR